MRQKDINTEAIFLFHGQALRFLGGKESRVRLSEVHEEAERYSVDPPKAYRVQLLSDTTGAAQYGEIDGYPAIIIGDERATDEQLAKVGEYTLERFLGELKPGLVRGRSRFVAVTPAMMRDIEPDYIAYREQERARRDRQAELEEAMKLREMARGANREKSEEYAQFFGGLGISALPARTSGEPEVLIGGEALASLVTLLRTRLLPSEGLLGTLSVAEVAHAVTGGYALLENDVDEGAVLTDEELGALVKARDFGRAERYGEVAELMDTSTVPRALASLGTFRPECWEPEARERWTALLKVDGREAAWEALTKALEAVRGVMRDEAAEQARQIVADAFGSEPEE